MGQDRTLARGARVFGSLLLAALALVSLAWIIRDFTKADDVVDVWWNWAGLPARAEDGVWVASFLEPTLMLVYAVAAVTAYRSSSSAAILTASGALTVALRTPGLWNLNADWMQGVPDGLLSKVLFTTIATVVLGGVLIVTAIAGRRPAQPAPGGYGAPAPHDVAHSAPAGPTRGGAVAAFLLLGASAAVLVAWEIRTMQQFGWDRYAKTLTGERTIVRLLDAPPGWALWTVVLLALVAGVAALAGAPFSRPLGLVVAGPLLALGLFAVAFGIKTDLFAHFGDLGIEGQLHVLTNIFEVVAGAAVLLALSRGQQRSERLVPSYPAGGPAPYAPPPQTW
ncbi:hypothetical protein [Streptomyces reniochalinae]|uniref:Uncharacterized protein n=1 Tax=Streptomyces reniochalinae TaxID=2250578 RepID=A0A367EXA6_9ACTN|nr:hypothetical protein [Streptomyces reniochalinae]RCG22641.1 hypothetical protein DQ392_06290 [Streptomyces reniochalinae]